MNLAPFTGPGSTPTRRALWDKVRHAVTSAKKTEGKNTSVTEYEGQGTLVAFKRDRGGTPTTPTGGCCRGEACTVETQESCEADGGVYQGDDTDCDPNPCVTPDCTSCDDLVPEGSPPPSHLNITIGLSGSCGDVAYSGTITYDEDMEFASLPDPVGGHFFCADAVNTNSSGGVWTGHLTRTCTLSGASQDYFTNGTGGFIAREKSTCEWWVLMGVFGMVLGGVFSTCDGCDFAFSSFFESFATPGDPSGVYVFTQTDNGVTITMTVTIT